MPGAEGFASFEEFWLHYLREHADARTRWVHFAATSLAFLCGAGGLARGRPWLLAAAPLVGYLPAWLSHLLIEGNLPATFGHPVWSARADLKMWRRMLDGSIRTDLERSAASGPEGGR